MKYLSESIDTLVSWMEHDVLNKAGRFYLNHTPFLRSETHRAEKTPAELLTGKPHPHWLEMLGYQRFKRVQPMHNVGFK